MITKKVNIWLRRRCFLYKTSVKTTLTTETSLTLKKQAGNKETDW